MTTGPESLDYRTRLIGLLGPPMPTPRLHSPTTWEKRRVVLGHLNGLPCPHAKLRLTASPGQQLRLFCRSGGGMKAERMPSTPNRSRPPGIEVHCPTGLDRVRSWSVRGQARPPTPTAPIAIGSSPAPGPLPGSWQSSRCSKQGDRVTAQKAPLPGRHRHRRRYRNIPAQP
jgi:hypothetical protein